MSDGLFGVPEDGVLAALWKVPGWPKNVEKDERFVRDLVGEFGQLNLVEEARKWHVWMLDRQPKGRVNYRARFRTWCRQAVKFRGSDRQDSRAPVTQSAKDGGDAGWAKSVGDRVPITDGWD